MDCQTITCPVCQKEHTGLPKDIGLVVYLAGECPICLEETSPVVALPCGHAVCEDDFVRLFIAAQQQKLEQEERDQLMDQNRCGGGRRRRITNVCDLQEMIFLNSSRSRRNRLFRDDMTHVSFTNNHPTQNLNRGINNNNNNNKENDDGSNNSNDSQDVHPFMPEPRVVVRKIPISSVVVEETNAERSVQMGNNNEKFLNTKVLKKRSNNVGSQLCITCSDDNGSMKSSKTSKSSNSSGRSNSFKSLRSRLSRKSISRKNQKNRGSFSSSGNSSCRSSKSIASAPTSSSSRSISSSSDIHNDTIVISCSSSSMEETNTSTNEPMETLQKFLEHMNQQMKSNLITKNPYTNAYLSTRLPAGGVDPR